MSTQAVGVGGGGDAEAGRAPARGEEGQVPVFGYVPVETVEGVEENEEEPGVLVSGKGWVGKGGVP